MSEVVQKFDMKMLSQWTRTNGLLSRVGLRTALSVGGVCAIGVIAWFMYYLSEDDDEEFKVHKTSRNVVIKVEIQKEDIGMIIGRSGSNLKYIERQTDTRINVDDAKDDGMVVRILTIRGTSDSVHNAENMIYSQINSKPVLDTKEMLIPTVAVGRVIGKVGSSIKEIIKKSNAKVEVENSTARSEKTKITIRGSLEQIALATELIHKKVEEYEEVKAKMNEGIGKRSPFRSLRSQTANVVHPNSEGDIKSEKLVSTSSDGSLTVFISSVINPDKFWVQIMNDRAVELDQLVDSMTDYYNQQSNQETHHLDEVNVGQIVAVLFHLDQKWYRAQVTAVTTSLELYFVDYGDSVDIPLSSVFGLNPDFLGLRFQAIECGLANVKPAGDSWSEEAISCFEDLTHVAQWKPLVARVESYREQRSGSPLPCVCLFDTSGEEKDVNISEELISRGYAVKAKSSTEMNNGSSSGSSDSDTLVENSVKTTSDDGKNLTLLESPNKSTASERPSSVTSYEPPSSMSNVSKGEKRDEKKKRKF